MSNLTNNTTELQEILEILQDKVTGVTLPELTNEATSADLAIGKQLIDSQGNIVTGTNPYEQTATNEAVVEQSDVIDEIEEVVDSLPEAVTLQKKIITPANSIQIVTPDSSYDGLSEVVVNAIPSEYIVPSGMLNITENGTKDVTNYQSVTVNVASGGSTIESVICTVSNSGPAMGSTSMGGEIHFLDENGVYCITNQFGPVAIMKDSILFAKSSDGLSTSGGIEVIGGENNSAGKCFHVTGDFTIEI